MKQTALRGQPLLLLVGIVLGWAALRVAFWEAPVRVGPGLSVPLAAAAPRGERDGAPQGEGPLTDAAAGAAAPRAASALPPHLPLPTAALPLLPRASAMSKRLASEPAKLPLPAPFLPARPSGAAFAPAAPAPVVPVRAAVGHNLLLMAGLAQMEVPPALLALLRPASDAAVPRAAPARVANRALARWSADAWVMLRQGGAAPLLPSQPGYGRSQAGAVVRYRLAPQSARQPQAYLRGALALAGGQDRELAAGVSARPLARVPVRLLAELRVADTAAGAKVRPAALAVSELPVVPLPLGARAEGYVQAGYVGGDYATAFVDGQARVDRPLLRVQGAELGAGAGVWGGAQKGAARLDIGPTASLAFNIGDTRSRLAVDYRFRVAGDAQPASGPAVTLSAGF